MPSSRRVNWSRLSAEAFVVVASIVLALAVDEWRVGLADRALETEYLSRLVSDANANLGIIESQRAQQAFQLESAHLIYPLVRSGDWRALDTATVIRAAYLATPSPTPSWVDDTFEELKSTGRMALIRNPTVRSAISAYYRELETGDYTYELMSTEYRDQVRRRMDPGLQLRLRADCVPRDPQCEVPVESPHLDEFLDWLTANETLAGQLTRVITQWTRAEQEYLPDVEEETVFLLSVLTDEPAGK